jgi:subtilisin family serine protease
VAFCTVFIRISPSSRHTAQTIYVLDSGIQANHPSLAGRVVAAAPSCPPAAEYNATEVEYLAPLPSTIQSSGSNMGPEDFLGRPVGCAHGTQVASLIAGRGVGINDRARLVDVRVLDERGEGRTDDILAALDYVAGE